MDISWALVFAKNASCGGYKAEMETGPALSELSVEPGDQGVLGCTEVEEHGES